MVVGLNVDGDVRADLRASLAHDTGSQRGTRRGTGAPEPVVAVWAINDDEVAGVGQGGGPIALPASGDDPVLPATVVEDRAVLVDPGVGVVVAVDLGDQAVVAAVAEPRVISGAQRTDASTLGEAVRLDRLRLGEHPVKPQLRASTSRVKSSVTNRPVPMPNPKPPDVVSGSTASSLRPRPQLSASPVTVTRTR